MAGRPLINPTTWGTPLNSQPGTASTAAKRKETPRKPKKNSVKRKIPQAKGGSQISPWATKSVTSKIAATPRAAACGLRPQLRPKPTTTKSEKYHQENATPIQYRVAGKAKPGKSESVNSLPEKGKETNPYPRNKAKLNRSNLPMGRGVGVVPGSTKSPSGIDVPLCSVEVQGKCPGKCSAKMSLG